jgi:hypothetical protein
VLCPAAGDGACAASISLAERERERERERDLVEMLLVGGAPLDSAIACLEARPELG